MKFNSANWNLITAELQTDMAALLKLRQGTWLTACSYEEGDHAHFYDAVKVRRALEAIQEEIEAWAPRYFCPVI